MTQNKIEKLQKKLGKLTTEEMDSMGPDDLKQVIVQANSSMQQVKEELDANPKYEQVKLDKQLLETSKREVDARQKARISYALHLLDEGGAMVAAESTVVAEPTEK